MAADDQNVYWAEVDSDSGTTCLMKKAGLDGSVPTILTSTSVASCPGRLVLDNSNIYWVDTNSVRKVSKNDGTPANTIAGATSVGRVAVDANSLYWTDNTHDAVMKLTPK